MKEINEEIFNEIQDYLPEKWDKVIYWALYTNDSYSMKYFVKQDDKYIDCFDLYEDEELIDLFIKLDEIIQNYKAKLKEFDRWTSMVLEVNSDGSFKTNYDYADLNDMIIEYEEKLKKEYLK